MIQKIKETFKEVINNIKFTYLARKIFFWILMLVTIPIIIISLLIHTKSKEVLTNQIYYSLRITSELIEKQLLANLDAQKLKMKNIAEVEEFKYLFWRLLKNNSNDEDGLLLQTITDDLINSSLLQIDEIRFLDTEGNIIFSGKQKPSVSLKSQSTDTFSKQTKATLIRKAPFSSDRLLQVTSPVTKPKSKISIGVISVRYEIEKLDNIILTSNKMLDQYDLIHFSRDLATRVYFVDTAGGVVFGDSLLKNRELDLNQFRSSFETKSDIFDEFRGPFGRMRLGLIFPVNTLNLIGIVSYSKNEIFEPVNQLYNFLLLVMLLSISSTFFLSMFFSYKISKPIGNFINGDNSVSKGGWNKTFEEELKKSQSELRSLAGHLQTAREEERASIAREIHDELGQVLTSIKMNLSILGKEIAGEKTINYKYISSEFESMTNIIDSAVIRIRKLITELRPEILDKLGLIPALDWQIEEFERTSRIKCIFNSKLENIEIVPKISIVIFRVLQEALTNIKRHSGATSVVVDFYIKDDSLVLEISDNGKGISENEIDMKKSFGILGMRERAMTINGEFKIELGNEGGTKITLIAPLNRN